MKTKITSAFSLQPSAFQEDASGIDEIQRREVESAMREWRGFWVGLLIALMFGVTIGIVLFAVFYRP